MTMIEEFLSFTSALPSDRLESVEAGLAALMESYFADLEFTPQASAEIYRRLAVANPEFAAPARNGERRGAFGPTPR